MGYKIQLRWIPPLMGSLLGLVDPSLGKRVFIFVINDHDLRYIKLAIQSESPRGVLSGAAMVIVFRCIRGINSLTVNLSIHTLLA